MPDPEEVFAAQYKVYIETYDTYGSFADLSAISQESQQKVRDYVDARRTEGQEAGEESNEGAEGIEIADSAEPVETTNPAENFDEPAIETEQEKASENPETYDAPEETEEEEMPESSQETDSSVSAEAGEEIPEPPEEAENPDSAMTEEHPATPETEEEFNPAETTEVPDSAEPEEKDEGIEPAETEDPEEEAETDELTESESLPASPALEETAENSAAVGGFIPAEQADVAAFEANPEMRRVELQIGEHIITVYGAFPEGTELQAAEIPKEAAEKMSGKDSLFAYDIRLVLDGEVWQPEEHGTDVQVSIRNANDASDEIRVNILHVKADLLDEDGNLSEEALETTMQNLSDGGVETESFSSDASQTRNFTFDTSSFSGFIGSVKQYFYEAKLYKEETGKYPGVYATEKLQVQTEAVEKPLEIGIPSIADANLDKPTTESPAIIQGASVGYEEKIGPTEYRTIAEEPEPYAEFPVKVLEEKGADGTVHRKLSGFDGTYVIVRLDVSEFFQAGSDELYLHMEQKDNKALMPAATVAKSVAGYERPTNSFTDGLGNRSASYKLSDLVDATGETPYVDVIVFATAANVAGADTGKANTPNGDIPISFYVDKTLQYNDELVDYDPTTVDSKDPNAATAYDKSWHAKFFDAAKAALSTVSTSVSRFVVKGSDLALETSVEKSGGENKDTGTTYWSLKKSMEDPYYDQEIDKDPNDQGSGRTVKLMSEVAVTSGLDLQGTDENTLKKRTLDVNSYDIQIATNTGVEGQSAEDITLKNAWLTIADKSNTTGAEMAIGNNAKFVIDKGGKLIIDETCQLEIEWDGATTTPASGGQTQPAQPDILNNGQLDLRAGGEIVNNGIITIEGTEGKPTQQGSGQEQQAIDSKKGSGEMTIRAGATLTNNGALVVYGKLNNLGTLVNNGRYDDVIKSNDPDKGAFDYHKGIQVAWKDDVTQKNIEAGSLINGAGGRLVNSGDIVLTPGTLDNKGLLINAGGANIYSATATEAIIPITPDPATPTVVTKRITLNPVKLSNIINSGTLINFGNIAPATIELMDNTGAFGKKTSPGNHPELFKLNNTGIIVNPGRIYGLPSDIGMFSGNEDSPFNDNNKELGNSLVLVLTGSILSKDDTWLYLYKDGTFLMVLPNGERLTGTYGFADGLLVFTMDDGTAVAPAVDDAGNCVYSITSPSGFSFEFEITDDYIEQVHAYVDSAEED